MVSNIEQHAFLTFSRVYARNGEGAQYQSSGRADRMASISSLAVSLFGDERDSIGNRALGRQSHGYVNNCRLPRRSSTRGEER